MTIDDVLFFDTETTGVPEKQAKWDTDYAECINPEQKEAKSADFEKITESAAMLLQQNDF